MHIRGVYFGFTLSRIRSSSAKNLLALAVPSDVFRIGGRGVRIEFGLGLVESGCWLQMMNSGYLDRGVARLDERFGEVVCVADA